MEENKRKRIINSYIKRIAGQREIPEEKLNLDQKRDYRLGDAEGTSNY